jgi:hypothetical protein
MSAERRQTSRRRTFMGGSLRFPVLTGVTSCVVRNVSETGAWIDVDDALWVPAHFEIEVPHLRLHVCAKVVWRRENAIGVTFEKTRPAFLQSKGGTLPHGANLQDRILFLEQERAKLTLRVRQLSDEI